MSNKRHFYTPFSCNVLMIFGLIPVILEPFGTNMKKKFSSVVKVSWKFPDIGHWIYLVISEFHLPQINILVFDYSAQQFTIIFDFKNKDFGSNNS